MALQITVKDISGNPIQGVEVKYSTMFGLNEIETKTTNSSGIVTLTTFDKWLSGYVLDFKKSGYVSYRYSYADHKQLPTGNLNITLSPAILYFKLYKYNEDTKTEELYKQTIKVEPYRYANGTMTAQTAINSLSKDSDGYYYIDLRDYGSFVNVPSGYTNLFLFKITANDLTNYGSIFLLPNGFIKKRIANWDSAYYEIEITENTLPNQTMVFYPNTKRLTKAELKKCVVSNPHLMNDAKDDTYCPTNITYSTIYNMIKDSNNRDNNYISGVEDINFYQNKVLTITNSASNTCSITYYIDAPGKNSRHATLAPGASKTFEIYYSADVQVHAVPQDGFSQIPNEPYMINMDEDKTITIEVNSQSYDYTIDELKLEINYCANTGEAYEDGDTIGMLTMKGHWGSVVPTGVISAAFVFFDGVGYATAVFDSLPDSSDVNGVGSNYVINATIYANADGSSSTTSQYGLNVTRKDKIKLINRYFSDNVNLKYVSGGNYYEQANYPINITFSSGNCSSGDSSTTDPDGWRGGNNYITFYMNNDVINSARVNFYDLDGNSVTVDGVPIASKNCQTCDWEGNNEYDIQDSNGNSIDGGAGSGSFDSGDWDTTDNRFNIYLT